jgi:beta-N-acetylhexosaminidase
MNNARHDTVATPRLVARRVLVLVLCAVTVLGSSILRGSTAAAASSGCTDVSAFSLTDRLNELIMVSGNFSNLAASAPYASAGIGAFVMYGQPSAGSGPAISSGIAALYNDARAAGRVLPWVSTDEEGGSVARLSNVIGALPSARQMASQWTPAQVQSAMATHGSAMWNLGVIMDLAPVLDTANPSNTIADENERSFSENGLTAAKYGVAYARGLRSARVVSVGKHFPGLGHASANTDLGPATDPSLAQLQASDLIPFEEAISAGIPVIMISHASVPGLTGTVPASLSPATYQYLRNSLLFNGVTITDSLSAGAISAFGYAQPAAAVRAVESGADMVMISSTQWQATLSALQSAVSSGALPLSQLNDSVGRILTAKGISVCAPSQFINTSSFHSATSYGQYQLTGSDGHSWMPIDPNLLGISLNPAVASTAVVGGNADLWTATPGINQDIGIAVSVNGGPDALIAWKESGGFAGTFSPNAAYVQGVYAMQPGSSYRFRLVWKANRTAGNGIIFAGAGPANGRFSPTQLTVRIDGAVPDSVSGTDQYVLTGSDGQTWQPLSATYPALTLTPATTGTELIQANADLWTEDAGYNQDIGIFADLPDGSEWLIAWKESGGFAGTFSPNAAFVQGLLPVTAGQAYTVRFKWKANKPDPGTIVVGAGPINGAFSPTRLSARMVGDNPPPATSQFSLRSSDGTTWNRLGSSAPSIAITAAANEVAVLRANADLWTANAGYNQDVGITMSVDGGAPQLIGWKESGGFAGTFSPNAAFVESPVSLIAGHAYTFTLAWKTNRFAPGATIYSGAGPIAAAFSPTSLTLELFPSP